MTRFDLRQHWTGSVFLYVALLGVLVQLRGALLPSFERTFAASAGALGLLSTASAAGFLISIFATGFLVSRIDVRALLAVGLAGMGIAVLLLAVSPTFVLFLGATFAAGVLSGVLHGLDRPILSHLHPDRRGQIFNLDDLVWAVGATLGPLVATVTLLVAGWRAAYLALGVAFLGVAALVRRLDDPPGIHNEQSVALAEIRSVLSTPALLGMSAGVFLLGGVESGLFTWLPYYVGQSMPRSVANLSLSAFLAAYIPGRYFVGRATARFGNLTLVLGTTVLTVFLLYLAFVPLSGYAMIAAIVGAGLCISGVFPTLAAWGTNTMPEHSGPIGALALGTNTVGFLVFPAAIGVVADAYAIGAAMYLLIGGAVALAVLLAVLRFVYGSAPDGSPGAAGDPAPEK